MNDDFNFNDVFSIAEKAKNEVPAKTTLENNVNDMPVELQKRGKTGRKFTIASIRRDMNDYEKSKNHSAVMAGICILGAAAAAYFYNQDTTQVVSNELDAIYSLNVVGQYIKDIGPVTTLLSAGALGFVSKYLIDSVKLKNAQEQFRSLLQYIGLEGEKKL